MRHRAQLRVSLHLERELEVASWEYSRNPSREVRDVCFWWVKVRVSFVLLEFGGVLVLFGVVLWCLCDICAHLCQFTLFFVGSFFCSFS